MTHEIGHHIDRIKTKKRNTCPHGEKFANSVEKNMDEKLRNRYFEVFSFCTKKHIESSVSIWSMYILSENKKFLELFVTLLSITLLVVVPQKYNIFYLLIKWKNQIENESENF